MKTRLSILTVSIIILLGIGFNSCELEEYNPSGSTADAIWSTPEGFQTLVNAAYFKQRNWYGKVDGPFMSEVGTDLWFNKGKDSYHRQTSKYEGLTPLAGNFNIKQWPSWYEGLNICNAGIGRINDANFTSEVTKHQKEGELRFLRAFTLWHIVETWGGVYLSTEETTEPILSATRSSVRDFYMVIIDDLEKAVGYLPNQSFYGGEYSRASKKSAVGLLARMYITWAYYCEGEEATGYFTKARDMANLLINNPTDYEVELYDNPDYIWDPLNNRGNINKEALYVISNSTTNTTLNYDGGHKLPCFFLTAYSGKPGLVTSVEYGNHEERRFMPTLYLLDLFDETIDARYHASFQEVWLCNDTTNVPRWTKQELLDKSMDTNLVGKLKFTIGDTALVITKKSISKEKGHLYTIIDRDSIYNASTDHTIRDGQDYPALIKFDDPLTRETPDVRLSTSDIIIMRLAEMYLISAEASMHLNHKDDAYATLLELAKHRAYGGEGALLLEAYGVSSGNDIDLNFILDERARELCGEHYRWFDLKRPFVQDPTAWVNYIKQRNPDITLIQEHHIIRPVPQEHLDPLKNSAEFGQNPGY